MKAFEIDLCELNWEGSSLEVSLELFTDGGEDLAEGEHDELPKLLDGFATTMRRMGIMA